MCTCSFSLPSGDAEGGYQWEVQTLDGWTLYWKVSYALTTTEGDALGHSVICVSLRVLAFAYRYFSTLIPAGNITSGLDPETVPGRHSAIISRRLSRQRLGFFFVPNI
jgi:hypothetical protein